MELNQARSIIVRTSRQNYGNYYSPISADEAVGLGQIFRNVRYPQFNSDDRLYDTYIGYVYVMTHECDISQENIRPFNKNALICPVLPFEPWLSTLNEMMDDEHISHFISNLATEKISRLKYIPEINSDELPYGGVLDLNRISNTNIGELSERVTSLTNYSLQIMDIQLTNHLLRPKAKVSSTLLY